MSGRWGRGLAAALVMLGSVTVGAMGTAAQDATPTGEEGDAAASHPAHLHSGTCADLDPNPAFPLTDVAPLDAEAEGAETAIPVEQSVTELDVPLNDLLSGDHAINVHESQENLDNYIACGDVGGAVAEADGGGRGLAIGLREQNASGYSGVAWLEEGADGGTTVTIFLARGLAEDAGATPAAAAEADELTIEIVDFFFEPAEATVTVGTTVTWVNVGPTIHTTTALIDGDRYWDSKIMEEGDTFSFTFEEAGTFDYLCAIHPSMTASIEVVP